MKLPARALSQALAGPLIDPNRPSLRNSSRHASPAYERANCVGSSRCPSSGQRPGSVGLRHSRRPQCGREPTLKNGGLVLKSLLATAEFGGFRGRNVRTLDFSTPKRDVDGHLSPRRCGSVPSLPSRKFARLFAAAHCPLRAPTMRCSTPPVARAAVSVSRREPGSRGPKPAWGCDRGESALRGRRADIRAS